MLLVLQSETSTEHDITFKTLTLLGLADDEEHAEELINYGRKEEVHGHRYGYETKEYESNMILSMTIMGK